MYTVFSHVTQIKYYYYYYCTAMQYIVYFHFARRMSLCIILLHILIYNILHIVQIVLIILLASRKHIESDNMDGTGDPPPLWPVLLIGSVLLRQCFKSILCLCWAQVLNPNVIVLDCQYTCVSSYQLCYMIQKNLVGQHQPNGPSYR